MRHKRIRIFKATGSGWCMSCTWCGGVLASSLTWRQAVDSGLQHSRASHFVDAALRCMLRRTAGGAR